MFIFGYDGVTKATDYEEDIKLQATLEVTTDTVITEEVIIEEPVVVEEPLKKEIKTVEEPVKDIEEPVVVQEKDENPVSKDPTTDSKPVRLVIKEEADIVLDETSDLIPQFVGNLILFRPDALQRTAPGLRYEKSTKNDNKTDYEMPDFLPDSEKDFYLAYPKLKRSNNIIIPSDLKIKDDLGVIIFNQAENSIKSNTISTAITILEKLLYYNYDVYSTTYSLAYCYYKISDFDIANKYLAVSKTVVNDLNLQSMSFELSAEIQYNLKEYNLAYNDYLKALSKDRGTLRDGDLFYKASLCLIKLNKLGEAKELLEIAVKNGNRLAKINLKWLNEKLTNVNK
ncbi:MAG: hypothetical protein A2015_08110 [Spirochaetes bacterium GWF1_31_7]|nr:MAG: hypothetical protein A2Y30_02200 [Spirochaetes bacterium GWE1_32_154]OHD47004.1 MAG: hypothetical protein A2015_08110 [Spirochaetes bacterium GWF1_31_7]OHD49782.1 MAG: hypothetical protein A2Y29_06310 [Spirochaetes bacterium GWE2_31_10]OHD79076.1 MAG: hypothetical protein A2355_00730 [Spirochaetes bacterium RIFOXYB1_FULL_32_8]HBD95486.1 hypothetical protein [Spirochaetia bacterium]